MLADLFLHVLCPFFCASAELLRGGAMISSCSRVACLKRTHTQTCTRFPVWSLACKRNQSTCFESSLTRKEYALCHHLCECQLRKNGIASALSGRQTRTCACADKCASSSRTETCPILNRMSMVPNDATTTTTTISVGSRATATNYLATTRCNAPRQRATHSNWGTKQK